METSYFPEVWVWHQRQLIWRTVFIKINSGSFLGILLYASIKNIQIHPRLILLLLIVSMSQPRPINLVERQRYMGVVQFLCVNHVHYNILKLIPLNSTGVLVGPCLFCIQYLPCLVNFRCMFRVGVEVWQKNVILYRVIIEVLIEFDPNERL